MLSSTIPSSPLPPFTPSILTHLHNYLLSHIPFPAPHPLIHTIYSSTLTHLQIYLPIYHSRTPVSTFIPPFVPDSFIYIHLHLPFLNFHLHSLNDVLPKYFPSTLPVYCCQPRIYNTCKCRRQRVIPSINAQSLSLTNAKLCSFLAKSVISSSLFTHSFMSFM